MSECPLNRPQGRREWGRWRVIAPVALACAAALLGAWNAHWRSWNRLDELPEQWDEAHFTSMSIRINDKMRRDPAEAYDYFIHASPNQAPFVSLLGSFLYFALPRTVQTALNLNTVCVAALLLAVYYLGARRSLLAGAVAAAAAACMSPFIEYMRLFRTELPLAAWVALAMLFIMLSDRFRRIVPSVLAGVMCGAAMLTNPIALVFLLWPVLYALVRGIVESRLDPARMLNFALGLIAAYVISATWYLPNQDAIRRFLLDYGFGASGAAYRAEHPGFALYPQLILRDLGPGIILVAVAAALAALVFRRAGPQRVPSCGPFDIWLIVVWVASSYITLNLTRDQQTRFLLPLLPGAAILLGALIDSIRCRIRLYAVLGMLLAANAAGLHATFSTPLTHVRGIDITGDRDWRMKEIARTIADDSRSQRIPVAFLANHALFTAKGFDLAALLDGHDFQVNYTGDYADENEKMAQVRLRLKESRYAVFKEGRQMEEHATRFDIPFDAATKAAEAQGYEKIRSFTLPDGAQAVLYKKTK